MSINLFQYYLALFLQKSHGASCKFHFPIIIQNIFSNLHFKYVQHLLSPYFMEAMKDVQNNPEYEGQHNSNIIWIFWWQGYESMPLIVKKCYQSVKDHSNNHKIILLTKNNVKKYAKLPNLFYEKVSKGTLDLTHFSDVLRFNLLDNYGGLWVDATMYCTSNLTDNYFKYLYTTGGYHGTIPKFVKGRWAEFLIGGNSENKALEFEDNYLQDYYSQNNIIVDYFLADYALNYSYNHNLGNYRNYVDNEAKGANPHLFKLVNLLNKSFSKKTLKKLISDTNMFKLTYKQQFDNNSNTFYSHLIHNNLYKK